MNEIIEKYTDATIKNLNKDNMLRIIDFLKLKKCNFIEDILEDYLDLFTIEYSEFVNKYNELNKKYNFNLLNEVSLDMNILEEFFE